MKITKFLGLSCFLFAFIATSFPEAVHAKDAAAVLDIFDKDVLAGGRYLIIAPSTENTTTLEVTATSKVICNSDVILSTRGEGLPVTFSPATTSKDGVIREGTIVNVNFDAPLCPMVDVTTMWMIRLSSTTEGYILTTGGVDRLNQFMITKSEGEHGFYQLSFCPKCEPFCTCECVPVGVNADKHLVPNSGPLLVKFEPDN